MASAREVVEGFYEAFNRGDLDSATTYFTEDIENIDPSGRIQGLDAFRAFIGGFKTAMPDAQLVVRLVVESGDTGGVRGQLQGNIHGAHADPEWTSAAQR
jgi:ketosteroid isomerase-like protein